MALGQYIAGMGFSNVGLGIVHSIDVYKRQVLHRAFLPGLSLQHSAPVFQPRYAPYSLLSREYLSLIHICKVSGRVRSPLGSPKRARQNPDALPERVKKVGQKRPQAFLTHK